MHAERKTLLYATAAACDGGKNGIHIATATGTFNGAGKTPGLLSSIDICDNLSQSLSCERIKDMLNI